MKTQNQIAYDKEIRRINRFIKSAEARGFIFDKEAIQKMIPERGQRITQSKINTMKAIKPEKLYSKATYRDPNTGVVMSGFKGREQERKQAAMKGYKERQSKEAAKTKDMILLRLDEMMSRTWAPNYFGFMECIGMLADHYGSLEMFAEAVGNDTSIIDDLDDYEMQSNAEPAGDMANSVITKIGQNAGVPQEKIQETQQKVDDYYV